MYALTDPGPSVYSFCSSRWPYSKPPADDAVTTPMSKSRRADGSNPAPANASSVATSASCVTRSVGGISRPGSSAPASKSAMTPASRTGYGDASNRVIGPMADRPDTVADQYASTPIPFGAVIPIPVTTALMPAPRSARRRHEARRTEPSDSLADARSCRHRFRAGQHHRALEATEAAADV